jgi:erythromycin esterase
MTTIHSALVLVWPLVQAAQAPATPVRDWIAEHAIRLQTPEAGHGFADMESLKKVVGNARIVSLGEATHGTREFFQLKHRTLEFLATEMGFTIFSIEANMPEAYRLNDYILTGKGDPAELLRGMYFWTWNTEEVFDMILWMREFNKSGKGRLQFTGFDIQTTKVAEEIARDFIIKYDPGTRHRHVKYRGGDRGRRTQQAGAAPIRERPSCGTLRAQSTSVLFGA